MIQPEFTTMDDALEYAAQLIEDGDFSDLRGIMAKKKRDREDADLRLRTIQETRQRCAEHIRAMKSRRDLDAVEVLKKLANLPGNCRQDTYIRDAWPLAWKGWLDIECRLRCNSNSIPPETEYRIIVTEEGRKIIAASN